MKKLILLAALSCSFSASAQFSEKAEFFKPKVVGNTTFQGCLIIGKEKTFPIASFVYRSGTSFYFNDNAGTSGMNIEDKKVAQELYDRYRYLKSTKIYSILANSG